MSLIQQSLPLAKTAITNNLCPASIRLCNNVNQVRLLSNDSSGQKIKLKDKIKQSKLFNRKNRTTQYQSLRKEKKKSQKTPPPPSGSHPLRNTVVFLGGAAALSFLFFGIFSFLFIILKFLLLILLQLHYITITIIITIICTLL